MAEMKSLTLNGKTYDSFVDKHAREKGQNPGGSIELDNTLSVSGKAADAKAVGDALKNISGGAVVAAVEPAEDDIPKVFFGGPLQQTKDEAVVPFRYISKTKDVSGYAEIKAQGNSSMNYPKKNQNVKLYKDAYCTEKLKMDFKGWGKQNKHVHKANWIDLSHSRNVVSARLWGDVVKSRANYAELPELLRTSPNQGAVDGFPVKVYAAGVYQGRYTLNIPKDKWMANMDDGLETHCILCSENYVSGCFRAAANINGNDWTDEIHDVVPESIKTRWNEVISFVMNSTDGDFKANLGNYFYVDSLIDYHLFGLLSCGLDAYGKNQLYMTYDGQKWIANMYDMDSTWGLYWDGSKFVGADYTRTRYEDFVNTDGNLLYVRLEKLFAEELQTRWAELKSGALSIENIINRFERFTDIAPRDLVSEDYASTTGGGAFTEIPQQTTNNIKQIRAFALDRIAWCDTYIANLTTETIPCTGITLSTNTLSFNGEGMQTLTASVTPDGCTDAVRWASDTNSVATVDNGIVTAVANGTAVITATCGNYSANCNVTVEGIGAEENEPTGDAIISNALLFDLDLTKASTDSLTISDNTGNLSATVAAADAVVDDGVCMYAGYKDIVSCTWVNTPNFNTEFAIELFCFGFPKSVVFNSSYKSLIFHQNSAGVSLPTTETANSSTFSNLKTEAPCSNSYGETAHASGSTNGKVTLDDGTEIMANEVNISGFNSQKYFHIVYCFNADGTITAYANGYPLVNTFAASDFSAWNLDTFKEKFAMFRGAQNTNQILKSARMYNRCLTKAEVRNNLAFEAAKLSL